MSILTYVGAGQMASALTFPAVENGHEVRLVGTHLDREIIDELRRSRYHITLKRTLLEGIKFYQIEEVEEALEGADVVVCGVSSFGVDWFAEKIIPILPESAPVLSVTKGMLDQEGRHDDHLPRLFQRADAGRKETVFQCHWRSLYKL